MAKNKDKDKDQRKMKLKAKKRLDIHKLKAVADAPLMDHLLKINLNRQDLPHYHSCSEDGT